MKFSNKVTELARVAEAALAERFAEIDAISFANTEKIMDAFKEHRVSEAMFTVVLIMVVRLNITVKIQFFLVISQLAKFVV